MMDLKEIEVESTSRNQQTPQSKMSKNKSILFSNVSQLTPVNSCSFNVQNSMISNTSNYSGLSMNSFATNKKSYSQNSAFRNVNITMNSTSPFKVLTAKVLKTDRKSSNRGGGKENVAQNSLLKGSNHKQAHLN